MDLSDAVTRVYRMAQEKTIQQDFVVCFRTAKVSYWQRLLTKRVDNNRDIIPQELSTKVMGQYQRKKRCDLLSKDVLLLADNTSTETLFFCMNGYETLLHSLYSPDLALSDFLFSNMKKYLWRSFFNDDEVITALESRFNSKSIYF